jgi:catechol 2,3-dioxygenase-like lactoylglutathione lyase family enzyme
MKLATLMVLTPDLPEARRFYETILGFGVASQTADLLVLDHEGAAFHVYRCEAAAPPTRHGRDGASVFVFAVASIEDAMADLRAKGVEFLHTTPAANRFGRYAAFRGPGGNIHEIFQGDDGA